jgi:hypothetical protein
LIASIGSAIVLLKGGRDMILKQADDKQADIDILHNLAGRASSNRQRHDIQSEIDNIVAGMRGEQDASYYLDQEFRHRDDAVVIHDLRLEEEGDVAQIDHIVISRRRQVFVLETKALKASISCNDAGEWEAVYGRERYPIASPLEQCKRHAAVLRRWLGRRETALREVIPIVLIAPTTKIGQRAASHDDPEVVKSDMFPRRYEQHASASGMHVIRQGAETMSEDELAGIGYRLVRAHTPIQFDWRKRFGFPSTTETEAPQIEVRQSPTSPTGQQSTTTTPAPPASSDEKSERRHHIGKTSVAIANGSVVVFRYANGDRGMRCDDDSLKERVAEACRRANGRWVPFPRFWLLSMEGCVAAVRMLGGDAADRQTNSPETTQAKTELTKPAPIPTPTSIAASHDPIPSSIPTIHGDIVIRHLSGRDYSVRNPRHPDVIEAVKTACRGQGRWNARFSNWIITEDKLPLVLADIKAKLP